MSQYLRKLGKRKFYKKCLYMFAFRFAPTGAIQPVETKFRRQKK